MPLAHHILVELRIYVDEFGGVVFVCANQLLLSQVFNVCMCRPIIFMSSV